MSVNWQKKVRTSTQKEAQLWTLIDELNHLVRVSISLPLGPELLFISSTVDFISTLAKLSICFKLEVVHILYYTDNTCFHSKIILNNLYNLFTVRNRITVGSRSTYLKLGIQKWFNWYFDFTIDWKFFLVNPGPCKSSKTIFFEIWLGFGFNSKISFGVNAKIPIIIWP